MSNDRRNEMSGAGAGAVAVVPVMSNVEHVYGLQVRPPGERVGLRLQSKAQAEQVRCVDVARVG